MHEFLHEAPKPETTPGRMASGIWHTRPDEAQIALIGLPDDRGVAMNGGRVGAALGPAAFRAALARYGASEPLDRDWPRVCDVGDVQPGGSLTETHDRVSAAVGAVVERGLFPIAIGGGHDLTYAVVRAVAERVTVEHGVYFDAHLDVREQAGSGMSFRRLIEDCSLRTLHVHGLDRFSNVREHMAWFVSHGGDVDAFQPEGTWPSGNTFVSLDLDVIDQAYAPGVSAMNPCGWTPSLAQRWVRAAGARPQVRCFDIMELNPRFDEGGRTARLAARLFLEFLSGFAERAS
ncbi:MAG: formimidoylglutamase [Phycisphaerales bacterium]